MENELFERKPSLDQRIATIRERRTQNDIAKRMEHTRNMLTRKDNRTLEEKYNHDRNEYIKGYIYSLNANNVFHKKCLEIIEYVMVEYNKNLCDFLVECNDEEYYYTCYVVYLMVRNGAFSDEECLQVGRMMFKNAYEAEKYWKALLEIKMESKAIYQ